MSAQEQKKPEGLAARFIAYMLQNKPDLLFAIIRNTRPNLVTKKEGPVFVTRYLDVQEVLSRPDIFNVTYAPMMDPSVGPYMLGRDCTEINQRDKGIMRAFMRMEDIPAIKDMSAKLAAEAIDSQQFDSKEIEVVSTLSRWVPVKLTGEYFGFPGPDLPTMFRWSRATQYDMFHNLDRNEEIHQENIKAGHEMRAYLQRLLPERKAKITAGEPLDDVFSRLLKSTFDTEIGFDEERVITNVMGTLVGGIETTSQAIVQILDQLFRRPGILREAIHVANTNDDDLMARYCWEALRFNPINPFLIRRCAKDYRIAKGSLRSAKVPAGASVLVSTRSAMRDGRQLTASGEFVIDRPAYDYMHFGYGMHTCLGDQVASAEVPQVVKRILQLPGVRPASKIDFKGGPFPEEYKIAFG